MSSLFERLYRYKQSEQGRHQKENFLTQIFAHCLICDEVFRKRFLQNIGCTDDCLDFDCKTQHIDEQFGRPDVFIRLDKHTTVIIECKVDSVQGEMQLNRYADLLKSSETVNKHLIFLTKFYEKTPEFDRESNFRHIRWYEIFELLKGSKNEFSKELSNYLIEQKMNINMIPFTTSDKIAITNINDTIAKMDGFLSRLEDILASYTRNKIRKDKIGDLTSLGQYGIITDFADGTLWLGFYQYEHNGELQIGLDFTTPLESGNRKTVDKILGLNNWDTYDNDDNTRTWYNAKGLSFFITDNIFQAKDAFDFVEIELKKIKSWQ